MAIVWINDLSGGINQKTPTMLQNNEFEFLLNTNQQQFGDIASRNGATRFLDSVGSGRVRGLQQYNKPDGTTHLHMVANGNLYVNNALTNWTTQASNVWNESSEIDMVNYIGRHYYASSGNEVVKYSTNTGPVTNLQIFNTTASPSSSGSTLVATTAVFNAGMVGMTVTNLTNSQTRTITAFTNSTTVTVNSAINDTWDNGNIVMYFNSKYIDVNGAFMLLAGNNVFDRRTYFTNVDSDRISLETDYVITSSPPTGLVSFGNARPFLIFTTTNYLVFDPASIYVNEVEGYGCVNNKTIQNLKGSVIWLDRDAFYLLSPNDSYPIDISAPIKNDLNYKALFNLIDFNEADFASGVDDTRYYCAVKNLVDINKGETLTYTVFVFDIARNAWSVETYPQSEIASCFATFNYNGNKRFYAGSNESSTVFQLNTPSIYTDQNKNLVTASYETIVKTKHFDFASSSQVAVNVKNIKRIHLRYKASDPVKVFYALDGSSTYTQIGTSAELPLYTATDWTYYYLDLGKECKTISLQFKSEGDFIIYDYGFEFETLSSEGVQGY